MKKSVQMMAGLVVAVLLATAGTASASGEEAQPRLESIVAESGEAPASSQGSVRFTKYKVVGVSKTSNWTNKSKQLGVCKVESGAGGGTCAISNSYSVATSVQTSLGASVGDISAGIGFDASRTVTGTITWTSPKAPVGTSYKAWAVGTRATYKVEKWVGHKALGQKDVTWKLDSTSGTLSAFSPVVGFAVGQ